MPESYTPTWPLGYVGRPCGELSPVRRTDTVTGLPITRKPESCAYFAGHDGAHSWDGAAATGIHRCPCWIVSARGWQQCSGEVGHSGACWVASPSSLLDRPVGCDGCGSEVPH